MRVLGTNYDEVRLRIVELVSHLDSSEASVKLPACPEWSIRDVLAHLAAICTDILSGAVQSSPDDFDAFTAAQVDSRRTKTVAEILAEWEVGGSQIAAILDDFPGRYGSQLVADVSVHEQDIRAALDRPGARDCDAIAIGTDFLVTTFVDPAASAVGVDPLQIRANGHSWLVGSGGPPTGDEDAWRVLIESADPSPTPDVSPVGELMAEPYELFRAVTGRRSASQIRSYGWTVDPEPYLPIFGYGPFTVRSTDLRE